MKKAILYIIISLVSVLSISAQSVNSTYFLNEWSQRHTLNAAFAPEYGYFTLPILGEVQLNLSSNIGLSTFLYPNNNELVTFLNSNVGKDEFVNKLSQNNTINQGLKLNLLSFGFYTSKMSFWSFDVSMRENLSVNMPIDFFRFLKLGMAQETNYYDLKNLSINQSNYAQVSLGYSRDINSKIRVGLNTKLLIGLSSEQIKYDKFDITLNNDHYAIDASGESLIMAEPIKIGRDTANNKYYDFTNLGFNLSKLKPAGYGVAFDFGVTYKPWKKLTLAAAVNDLGFIKWKGSSIKRGVARSTVNFDGLSNVAGDTTRTSLNDQVKQLKDDVTNLIKFEADTLSLSTSGYKENMAFTINSSAEYSIFGNEKHDILLGLLWHYYNRPYTKVNEVVGAVTFKPFSWFTVSGTCELLREEADRYGLGLNFSPGWINLFLAADYISPRLDSKAYYPVDKFDFNLTFGGSYVLGRPRDDDKDGVVNRRDKCPETPFGVFVDKKGCPLDADGDGVPDYLDKCPNTPKEAYGKIDTFGCPLDTDGDSVPDYLDKCPDTPPASKEMVDSVGCSLDTDKDGVFDYMDKCPNTPVGIEVDSVGCPSDKDGDGVADYLDLCPNTPAQAHGMVDKNGCPLDTDGDGIDDYLDLCPNTPAEARGFVDKNGCLLDSDDDGVPDYLDKCPNTPAPARGFVDKNGCPRDTDGDSIPDYLDNCPTIPGIAANKGCPEIKKEVKTLFKKALQGIQFETGKTAIKKTSFDLLDLIAKVLIDNPSYLIEIRGHTDNVGQPAANLVMSENRAAAVRDYLISKGVNAARMTSHGFGDTQPIAPNKTTAGKAKNRRVEFIVSFEAAVTSNKPL
jgi:outer membrane protein OmpA-like peptidoglycan-associated protein